MRVIGGGVGREAARGAMLETLVDGEDDELTGAAELALHEDAGEVALGARIVALVAVENLFDALGDAHDGSSFFPEAVGRVLAQPLVNVTLEPRQKLSLGTAVRHVQ